MSKLVLTDITSGYASTTATNANNTLIETALENTLSRNGESPNQMLSDLDMNGHRILNILAQSGEGFIWKGAWVTSLVYVLNNLVSNASSSYICTIAHTAGTNFATDLAAGKWQLLAQQGLPGAGTGDMLVANNLSELTATKTTARGNISAASSGVNNDITQLTGLTTPLSVAQGGTGLNAVGTSGNVLTSNGTVWTSTAPSTVVTSFNTRTGVVSLSSSDVTTALTYTPSASTHNHSGVYVGVDHGHNAVGSLCFARHPGGGVILNPGDTYAGSSLSAAGIQDAEGAISVTYGAVLTGTWRILGYAPGSNPSVSLYQRIA